MIVTRAPLRISFVGGGSDLPAFYREESGACVSAAIDKYITVAIGRKFDPSIRVCYSQTETVDDVADLQHELVRAALQMLDVRSHIEIHSLADIPSGTGLGSSSTYTVALLHALYAHFGRHAGAGLLARRACEIEIGRCRKPIGRQDQYAAAFGGLRQYTFHPDDSVTVMPILAEPAIIQTFRDRLLLLYTGRTRDATPLLAQQSQAVKSQAGRAATRDMVALAHQFHGALLDSRLGDLGEILHEAWMLKRSLGTGISSDAIDAWYKRARYAGAMGGKVLGAGGGGFLLIYAEPEQHPAIIQALPELRAVSFGFAAHGSAIVYGGDAP